jgi:3-hydroxyisobutyrate dehydrogenase-like beta-hydroxyacid dehydrogenase
MRGGARALPENREPLLVKRFQGGFMKIGFIGLGHMGAPIAHNLIRAGHDLRVYNRTRDRAMEFAAEGARIANSPAEAAIDIEVLVTMVSDDRALRHIVFGGDPDQRPAIAELRPGTVHMSMSTISVEMARELAREHLERGQHYVSAPVVGRVEAALERKLWIIAAGPAGAVERCRPLMEATGRGISVVSEEAWKANLVKIGVNFALASLIETFGEAFSLMEKSGVAPLDFLHVVNESFQSPVYANYGGMIAERRYEPAGFDLRLGLKDAELTIRAAEDAGVPMPIADVVRNSFEEEVAAGNGRLDWAAGAEAARRNAGLERTRRAGG